MIQGSVYGLQPRIDVTFRLAGQPDLSIECVVDTGFEGALTLPAAAVAAMRLPHLTHLNANLADGTNVRTDVHVATIVWNGSETDVAVLALGPRPLLGTAMLDGHELTVQFTDGGAVSIDTL